MPDFVIEMLRQSQAIGFEDWANALASGASRAWVRRID
jgi:hypothetical protein